MSSPASETAQAGPDPSDTNTVHTTSTESKVLAPEQNSSEQTATTTEELKDPSKQVSPPNVQTDTKDSSIGTNTLIEPKVTSKDNLESNAQPDSKMPDINETNSILEKNVQKTEEPKTNVQEIEEPKTNVQETTENKAAESKNDSIQSTEKNETIKTDGEKTSEKTENPTTPKGEPSVPNENKTTQEKPEPEEVQQNEETDSSDCVNIQELTEHVMNILNDEEVVENALSEQQLLKKNIDLQQFIVKLIHLLKEKTDLCANLDRQNSALISQAKSLKDVIAITKDLLGIRNMEIEHLHADMAAMEESIKEERNRNNLSVQRLSEAMTLNDKLKTEYLTQMDLFQKLREKYNEKVVYLTRENQRLNALVNPDAQPAAEANANETNDQSNQVESVDK